MAVAGDAAVEISSLACLMLTIPMMAVFLTIIVVTLRMLFPCPSDPIFSAQARYGL